MPSPTAARISGKGQIAAVVQHAAVTAGRMLVVRDDPPEGHAPRAGVDVMTAG